MRVIEFVYPFAAPFAPPPPPAAAAAAAANDDDAAAARPDADANNDAGTEDDAALANYRTMATAAAANAERANAANDADPAPAPSTPVVVTDCTKNPADFFVRTVVPCHIVFVPLYMYQTPVSFRIKPLEVIELRVGDVWSFCNALALSYRPRMATWNSKQLTLLVKNVSPTSPIDIEKGSSVINVLIAVNDNYSYVCYKPLRNDRMSVKI
jgi:hypothetical protein